MTSKSVDQVKAVGDGFLPVIDLSPYDEWISNLHRVINPPKEDRGGSRRLSIVYFQIPNYDAQVECLPTCRASGKPEKYSPIQVADYYLLKRKQQRGDA